MSETDKGISFSGLVQRLLKRKNTQFYWANTQADLKERVSGCGFDVTEQKTHEESHELFSNKPPKPNNFFIGEYYNYANTQV